MLRSTKDLVRYRIAALDGDIGQVKDFYFEDDGWVVRFLVVETGSWLWHRQVLIPTMSIDHPNCKFRVLPVSMNRAQVRDSSPLRAHLPVSRQHELPYKRYSGDAKYNWAHGLGRDAIGRAIHCRDDPRLRSCKAVLGYRIRATDGDAGRVDSLLVDEETWAVRYLVVETGNWWIGHKVLIAAEWATGIDRARRSVALRMDQCSIRAAPTYDDSALVIGPQDTLPHQRLDHAAGKQTTLRNHRAETSHCSARA